MSHRDIDIVKRMYECFNTKDIEGVLAVLSSDVAWANAMEGDYVHGPEGVREDWTRQWGIVDPHVEPVDFSEAVDGSIGVRVIQTVRDLDGNPLEGQTHGLKDKTVGHRFHMQGHQVVRFDVED